MFFHVRHKLEFSYARPVFLEPTTIRLIPRRDPAQRVLQHQLRLNPEPTGKSRILEANGSEAYVLWFDTLEERLSIDMEMVVQTGCTNPFDWIISHTGALTVPVSYPESDHHSLIPYRNSVHNTNSPVYEWAGELAKAVDHQTSDFLMHLADTIHRTFHHIGRPEGDPIDATELLTTRTGACRDTAMLYVNACRSQGLAARFVSGYSMHHPDDVSEHELHAWAEVYLPGGGWRGYDPSLGLAVADGHVVLTASPDHALAAPVSGCYRGTGVTTSMDYRVQVITAETLESLDFTDLDRNQPR